MTGDAKANSLITSQHQQQNRHSTTTTGPSPKGATVMTKSVEHESAECSTYAETRRICGAFQASAGDCFVRYVGTGGEGD